MNRAPARSVHLDDPPLAGTLAAIAAAAERGASSDVVARWTGEATRAVGDGRRWRAVLEELARRVRSSVTFGPDSYAGEDVQDVEETLERRRVGDCDDFAVAMLALGRRIGLRGAAAVFLAGEKLVAVHVVPAFEDPERPGEWVPVELTRDVPFGEWPHVGSGQWSLEPLQEHDDAGFGGLGLIPIVDSIIGLFTADKAAKATKSAAKDNRKAAEEQADALRDVAETNAAVEREKLAAAERNLERVLDFGRRAAPLLVGAVGLYVLSRLVGGARRAA